MDPKLLGFGMILAGNIVNGVSDIVKQVKKNQEENNSNDQNKED